MSWGHEAKRMLYCGVDDCGPVKGPRCANCAPFTIGIMPQKKPTKAPLCFKGHACKLSRHGENGKTASYQSGVFCDRCYGASSRDHNGGNWERWFCLECHYDLCLVCCPKPGDGDLPHKVSSDDLNAASLFARTGMPQLGMCRRIDDELGWEGRARAGCDALCGHFSFFSNGTDGMFGSVCDCRSCSGAHSIHRRVCLRATGRSSGRQRTARTTRCAWAPPGPTAGQRHGR